MRVRRQELLEGPPLPVAHDSGPAPIRHATRLPVDGVALGAGVGEEEWNARICEMTPQDVGVVHVGRWWPRHTLEVPVGALGFLERAGLRHFDAGLPVVADLVIIDD